MTNGKRGEEGYTLVELLVVLAILGLLATIATTQVLRYFSSAKAEHELGWKTHFPFPDTIRAAVEWLDAHGKLDAS